MQKKFQNSLHAPGVISSSNERTLQARADGSGFYEQKVFYATERDFNAKEKTYGTKQLIPLRYGVVPVRIPKKREPGHESAYNIPFTVRRRKDSNINGRYNVSLHDHHIINGPQRLMDDYDHTSEQGTNSVGDFERYRLDFSAQNPTYGSGVASCFSGCGLCPGVGSRKGIKQGQCYEECNRTRDFRLRFLQDIKQAVKDSERREVVVFIHGYNVSNEAALKSAAQFVFDTAQDYSSIDYPGKFVYKTKQRVVVAFDWSSHSSLPMYGFVPCVQDDRERAAEAGPKLAHLLLDLAETMASLTKEGLACNGIHIVAHSMGNYVLHYAMEHLATICPHTEVTGQDAAAAARAANLSFGPVGTRTLAASPAGVTVTGMSGTEGKAAATVANAGTKPSQVAGAGADDDLHHQDQGTGPVPQAQPVGLSPVVAAIAAEATAAAAAATSGGADAAVAAGSGAGSTPGPVAEGLAADAAGYANGSVDDRAPVTETAAAAAAAAAAGRTAAVTETTASSPNEVQPDGYSEPLVASPFVTSGHLQPDDDNHEACTTHAEAAPRDRPIDERALLHHASGKQLFSLLKTVIHAAADVGREDMETTISTVRTGALIHGTPQPQITLYASRRDQALAVSSFLRAIGKNKDGRAGFFMRLPRWREGHLFHPFLLEDVISVDATGFSKDKLGHGYFRDHRQVLTDISLAFEGHREPPFRTTITESKDGEEWKCQICNDTVAPNPKIVLYRVMTVQDQHDRQLQQCRQQLIKLTWRVEALTTCQDLPGWQQQQQQADRLEQAVNQNLQQEQLLDAMSSIRVDGRHRAGGLLSMMKSYLHRIHEPTAASHTRT